MQPSNLDPLLARLEPPDALNLPLRLRFGLACAKRVEHLLEDAEVMACLSAFEQAVSQGARADALAAMGETMQQLANRHPGSRSLDGVGHAAVSATYAVAQAIAGKARQAAEYAAYAAVYGSGGYGATSDPASFIPEQEWQTAQLAALLEAAG